MAQQVLVQLVDDLDGLSVGEVSTVRFSLDGVDYEIDLSSPNADQFRKILAEYVDAGRRTGGRLERGVRPSVQSADPGEAGLIREWARANGYELADRGRIPKDVTESYKSAQKADAKPKSKPRASRTPARSTKS